MSDENPELREKILAVMKSTVSYDQEEAAVDLIMGLIEEHHHCRSCDMHACGDLDRPAPFYPIKEFNPQTGNRWTEEEKREMEAHIQRNRDHG